MADDTRYYLQLRGEQWCEGAFMARLDDDGRWFAAFADVTGVDRPLCYGRGLDVRGLRPYVMTRDPAVAAGFLRDVFGQYAYKHLDRTGISEPPAACAGGPVFLEAAALIDGVAVVTAGCGRGCRQFMASVFGPDGPRLRWYDERPVLPRDLPRIGREVAGRILVRTLREYWNSRLAAFGLRLEGHGCDGEVSA